MSRFTIEELERILAVCRKTARDAGTLVKKGYRKKIVVEHKGVVDLVTNFDRASEELIRKELGALPFAVVGEEEGGARTEGEPVFYVDPVDGTTNFVHGHPFWCVSIGLVEGETPILGVVTAPMLGLEWYGYCASNGRKAVRHAWGQAAAEEGTDEELCLVSKNASFGDSLLATGFPYDRRTSSDNNFDAFVAIKRRVQAVRRCGSAALDLCLVADGTYEGYWERKLRPWDIAAGIAILKAAGGRVTDFEGTSSFLESGHVVATNGAIHDELLLQLARVRASTLPPAT